LQLKLTRDRTDYLWYSSSLQIGRDQGGIWKLNITQFSDVLHVFVDGQRVGKWFV
jgi:hypothetical protein